jgi:hypothetical protein
MIFDDGMDDLLRLIETGHHFQMHLIDGGGANRIVKVILKEEFPRPTQETPRVPSARQPGEGGDRFCIPNEPILESVVSLLEVGAG